ncbi:MAG: co-chaperone GroES [Omnitrophica WOR_2 bacterium RIFCSPLOWO2_12_FULL_51_8]|nr:MAG: co-chaperone GroES [Omnitrophica WOR_2 bacterium RIFCSPLOWO2_12_FULL_51_8]
MQLKPLGDHIIVEPLSSQEVTKSGIILPETAKEKPEQGTVIAVGPGKILDNGQRAPMDVAVGAIVVFKRYSPDDFKFEGKEYLILSQSDVLAIVA